MDQSAQPSADMDMDHEQSLPLACPPTQLKALQKDKEYLSYLEQRSFSFLEIFVPRLFSFPALFSQKRLIRLLVRCVYYCSQSIGKKHQAHQKTLGEEYCKIVKTNHNDYVYSGRLHSTTRKLSFLFLQCLFQECLYYLVGTKYDRYLRHNTSREVVMRHNSSREVVMRHNSSRVVVMRLLPDYETIVQSIDRLNFALFCVSGKYAQLSQRVTSLHYIYQQQLVDSHHSYTRIGYVLLLQLLVQAVQFCVHVYQAYSQLDDKQIVQTQEQPISTSSQKCSICLDPMVNPSVTSCGHMFCWTCIHDSLGVSAKCPFCRHSVSARKVVQLRNYQ